MKGPTTLEASTAWAAGAVHVLAKRPELRVIFPLADEIDTWVRWSA